MAEKSELAHFLENRFCHCEVLLESPFVGAEYLMPWPCQGGAVAAVLCIFKNGLAQQYGILPLRAEVEGFSRELSSSRSKKVLQT